jgi:hypothetical protein
MHAPVYVTGVCGRMCYVQPGIDAESAGNACAAYALYACVCVCVCDCTRNMSRMCSLELTPNQQEIFKRFSRSTAPARSGRGRVSSSAV